MRFLEKKWRISEQGLETEDGRGRKTVGPEGDEAWDIYSRQWEKWVIKGASCAVE